MIDENQKNKENEGRVLKSESLDNLARILFLSCWVQFFDNFDFYCGFPFLNLNKF